MPSDLTFSDFRCIITKNTEVLMAKFRKRPPKLMKKSSSIILFMVSLLVLVGAIALMIYMK